MSEQRLTLAHTLNETISLFQPNILLPIENLQKNEQVIQIHKPNSFNELPLNIEVSMLKQLKNETEVETFVKPLMNNTRQIFNLTNNVIDRSTNFDFSNNQNSIKHKYDLSSNCSNTYMPICSSNFVTYRNKCIFEKFAKRFNFWDLNSKQEELQILHNGKCCDHECSLVHGPVCDNQGQTHLVIVYNNFCNINV